MFLEVEVTEIGTAITTAAKRSQTYLIIIGVPLCVVIILMVAAIAIIVCVFKHGECFCFIVIYNVYIAANTPIQVTLLQKKKWKTIRLHQRKFYYV